MEQVEEDLDSLTFVPAEDSMDYRTSSFNVSCDSTCAYSVLGVAGAGALLAWYSTQVGHPWSEHPASPKTKMADDHRCLCMVSDRPPSHHKKKRHHAE